jgi:hypothetical protein
MPARPLGESDCECVHDGWLAQPVNALSSLTYTAAGIALALRARRHRPRRQPPPPSPVDPAAPNDHEATPDWLGADPIAPSDHEATPDWLGVYALVTAANGVGGVAYHGPGGPFSRWLHDAALLATEAVVVTVEVGEATGTEIDRRHAAAAAAVGAALATIPAISRTAQGALGLSAAAADVTAGVMGEGHPRRAPLAAIWITAAAINATTRTGAPLCRPSSALQGHAAWHALTALALWWWGRFTPASARQRHPPIATGIPPR